MEQLTRYELSAWVVYRAASAYLASVLLTSRLLSFDHPRPYGCHRRPTCTLLLSLPKSTIPTQSLAPSISASQTPFGGGTLQSCEPAQSLTDASAASFHCISEC